MINKTVAFMFVCSFIYTMITVDVYAQQETGADMCSAVLKVAVEEKQTKSHSAVSKAVLDYMCSEKYNKREAWEKYEMTGDLGIPGTLGLEHSNDWGHRDYTEAVDKMCSRRESSDDSSSMLSTLIKVTNKNVIDAWGNCVENLINIKREFGPGVYLTASPQSMENDHYTLYLKVVPSRIDPLIIGVIDPSTLECKHANKSTYGLKTNLLDLTFDCKKPSNGEYLTTINTNHGLSTRIVLPRKITAQTITFIPRNFHREHKYNETAAAFAISEIEVLDISGNQVKVSSIEALFCGNCTQETTRPLTNGGTSPYKIDSNGDEITDETKYWLTHERGGVEVSGLRISLKNKAEIDKIRLHQLGKLYCISGSCTAPDIPDVTQMNLSEASVFLDDGRGVIAEFPNIKNGNDWIEVIFPRR